jgi:2-keto-myo-inositol isomerase
MNRRQLLGAAAAGAALPACATTPSSAAPAAAAWKPGQGPWQGGRSPWPLCLDTATIRPASLEDKVRIAAEAGFDAIEPWEGELKEYERSGKSLADLRKRIEDSGLFVPSVIGLWDAIPATQEQWERNLVASRDRMRMASAIGSRNVQVIPGPAREDFDLRWAADRYRDLLEIGLGEFDLRPAMVFVEFLPGAKTMGRSSAIALDADHPRAAIIPDVFHMHIGGSGFHGLKHLNGDFIAIFQFNDAPPEPGFEDLEDKHRVFPGDGILPLEEILQDLHATGFRDCVSLELYNPTYWERDLLGVAVEGHRKTLEVIERAFA